LYGVDPADLLEEFLDQAMGRSGTPLPTHSSTISWGTWSVKPRASRYLDANGGRCRLTNARGLSTNLLRRPPLFEEASLSDVLAIRCELEGPLRGFRLAVSGFSCEI
jgi:hypothetical protein